MYVTANCSDVQGVYLIIWIFQDKELKSAATKRTEKDILAEHKKKEREAAKKGKQPYYLKKCNVFFLFLFYQLFGQNLWFHYVP